METNENTYLYHLDRVYKYGDPELIIPYFTGQQLNEVNREQFARYLNAVFGFHFELRVVIANLSRHYKSGRLPGSIVDFLEGMKKNLIENPYSDDFTDNNARSIERAVEFFQEDCFERHSSTKDEMYR